MGANRRYHGVLVWSTEPALARSSNPLQATKRYANSQDFSENKNTAPNFGERTLVRAPEACTFPRQQSFSESTTTLHSVLIILLFFVFLPYTQVFLNSTHGFSLFNWIKGIMFSLFFFFLDRRGAGAGGWEGAEGKRES